MGTRVYKWGDIKKESVFDWTAQTSKRRPVKMIRIDLFHRRRNSGIPREIKTAILKQVKRYVKNEKLPYVVINAELQKVFSENHEIPFYVLCITIDYRGDEPWRQRVNTEIRNVKGSGKLYLKCKGYINNELTRLILK